MKTENLVVYLATLISLFIFHRLYKWLRIRRRLPPGPPSVPILGSIPFLGPKNIGVAGLCAESLVRKYGNLVTVEFGTRILVMVNSYKLAKELFNRDAFSGRPSNYYFNNIRGSNDGKDCGIIFGGVSARWTEQRRFALKSLKDFGFGKKSLDSLILLEADELFDSLTGCESGSVEIRTTFNAPVVNVLWRIVTGERFDPNKKETREFMEKLNERFRTNVFNLYTIFPSLRKYGPYLGTDLSTLEFKDMIRIVIKKHMKKASDDPAEDFIDLYLKELGRRDDGFTVEQLVVIILDLFQAGAETTSTTLMWAVLYMASHEDVQRKCRAEILETIGTNPPGKDHMNRMTFVTATLMEIQRLSRVGPISLPHTVHEDVRVGDFVIPAKATFFANINHFLCDETAFPNPGRFDPDRFIENGVVKRVEQFAPFGVGKRICLGEALAKHELFIFFVVMLQKTKRIGFAAGDETPGLDDATVGMTRIPKPFKVNFVPCDP